MRELIQIQIMEQMLRFKIDLIIDQLAAKEMSIARFYMKTGKMDTSS